MVTGTVFNIQRYSTQDGPGIRTTIFLKGCPLCCAWCHNPEGISPSREIAMIATRCIACGQCRQACPFAASLDAEGPLPSHPEHCTLCGACVEACPADARQMVGRELCVEELLAEVVRDRVFFEESSGGITFSGGEPLAQTEFLLGALQACRAAGIHAVVDTSGFGCTDRLLEVAALTDLFLFDLKLMDDTRHRQFTGVPNRPILDNLRALDRVHDQIWARVPIIPGVNDAPADLEAIACFLATETRVRQVHLLPYHKTGLQKLRRLGKPNGLDGLAPPSAGQLSAAARCFLRFGLDAKAGG